MRGLIQAVARLCRRGKRSRIDDALALLTVGGAPPAPSRHTPWSMQEQAFDVSPPVVIASRQRRATVTCAPLQPPPRLIGRRAPRAQDRSSTSATGGMGIGGGNPYNLNRVTSGGTARFSVSISAKLGGCTARGGAYATR